MSKELLMKVGGKPVYLIDGDTIEYTGEMTIDADGCPRAYGPEGCEPEPLDYLGNAGYDGNWWGIVTDSDGDPYVQQEGDEEAAPFPGLYLSTTAYLHADYGKYDCRRYVDSEHVRFAVIPGNVRMSIPPKFLGCNVVVTDKKSGKSISCACCDVGPSNHLGEGSMALAKAFGLSPSPKSGGSSDRSRWLYRFYAGEPAKGWTLQ